MIKVLQNWLEIQAAGQEIQGQNLPLHLDVHKNWDHLLLKQAIETSDRHSLIVVGLDWKVFCKTDVVQLINIAKEHNLVLEKDEGIPNCVDKPINWNNYRYT